MNKSGAMLVELLISTLIAAMISMALIGTWYQTQRVSKQLESVIDQHTRIGLLHRQLLYDISGVFIPNAKPYSVVTNVGGDVSAGPVVPITDKKVMVSDDKRKGEEVFFEGKVLDDRLDSVTFITSNPLPGYWNDQVGGARPRVARVIYRLKEDPYHKNAYILYRQEGFTLPIGDYDDTNEKGSRSYPLITGIKNLQIKYVVINKKDISISNNEVKDDKDSYQLYSVWPQQKKDNEAKTEAKTKEGPPIIPNGIMVSGAMYDALFKRALPFSFVYTMMTVPLISAKNKAKDGAVGQGNEFK